MLAVSHHLIVQLSARLAGKLEFKGGKLSWFENYELLGDDIVIFDKEVADSYLIQMKKLGVAINLAKSVIAPKKAVFEFAKVTGHNNKDVSALSWKAFISQNTFMGRANIAFSLLGRPMGIDH